MGIAIQIGNTSSELGHPSFVGAFFDTIAGNLEPQGRGTRFPVISSQLYSGQVAQGSAQAGLAELDTIVSELQAFPPDKIIWDLDDRSKQPPWGNKIASSITDLSNYFVTSDGKDMMTVVRNAFLQLRDDGGTINLA